jgi:hypothetical protein
MPEDPIKPARCCLVGITIGAMLWVVIFIIYRLAG